MTELQLTSSTWARNKLGSLTAFGGALLFACLATACGDDSSSGRGVADENAPGDAARMGFNSVGINAEGEASKQLALTFAGETPSAGGSTSPTPTTPIENTAGAGGSAGSTPTEPEPPPVSVFCGDAVRGSADEECDDGPGDDDDLCSSSCQMTDNLAVPVTPLRPSRRLGSGRHAVSAGAKGFGVAFVESDAAIPSVGISMFNPSGKRTSVVRLGRAQNFVAFANPVVAALPDGSFAVAWTDLNADGDQLGIALQKVTPGATPQLSSLRHANTTVGFSQYDPDIIWTGTELVVAWSDDSDAARGPDLRYRRFDANLNPKSAEETLSAEVSFEGDVSLAPFGGDFAATWHEVALDGTSKVRAKAGSIVGELDTTAPGAADDKPALVELDSTHLLLAYTIGTDPAGTGTANVNRLQLAVIGPESVAHHSVEPLVPAYANKPEIAQAQPSIARIGNVLLLSWRSAPLPGNNGAAEELWLKKITWDSATETLTLTEIERALPRGRFNTAGDQRTPVLAASPVLPDGALAIAWDDYGGNIRPGQGKTDIVLQLQHVTPYRFCDAYGQQNSLPFTVGLSPVPDGSPENPFRICNYEQLKQVSLQPNAYFRLMDDIDLTELDEPLVTDVFSGTFDGGGHTLANLSMVRTVPYAGLFTTLIGDGGSDGIEDGVLKNVVLRDFSIQGTDFVGAAAGRTDDALIQNVHVLGGTIQSSADGAMYAGGLVAFARLGAPTIRKGRVVHGCSSSAKILAASHVGGLIGYGSCSDSYAVGDVLATAKNSVAGGLVGRNVGLVDSSWATGTVAGTDGVGGLVSTSAFNNARIRNSAAYGNVTGALGVAGLVSSAQSSTVEDSHAHGNIVGNSTVGGLIGGAFYTTVYRSYATGNVVTGVAGGGLIGYVQEGTTITDSFAVGAVSAPASGAGGLLGHINLLNKDLPSTVIVKNCFAAGHVADAHAQTMGGLVGADPFSIGVFEASFWDKDKRPGLLAISNRPDVSGVSGLSASELKKAATFAAAGWDLDNVWMVDEGRSYPVLRAPQAPQQSAGVLSPGEVLSAPRYILTFGNPSEGTDSLVGTGVKNHGGLARPPGTNIRLFDVNRTQASGQYTIAYKQSTTQQHLITSHIPNRVPKIGSAMFSGESFDGTALWLGHSRFLPGWAPPVGSDSPAATGVLWNGSTGIANHGADIRVEDPYLVEIPVLQNTIVAKSFRISAEVYIPSHIEVTKEAPGQWARTYSLSCQPYADRAGLWLTEPGGQGYARVSFQSYLDAWNLFEIRADVVTNGNTLADSSDDTGQVTYRYFINGEQTGASQTVTFRADRISVRTGPVRFGPAMGLMRGLDRDAPEAFVDNLAIAEILLANGS